MSDYGEIASLIATLAWRVDHGEVDNFRDWWVEDAELKFIDIEGNKHHFSGADVIETMMRTPDQECLHVCTTPIINIDGDEARVRYRIIHTAPGPKASMCGIGECDATVRRGGDGRWRMAILSETHLVAYDRV
jgi:hypothetical protein